MSSAVLKKVAVVIPCYNEALSIDRVIKNLPHQAAKKNSMALHAYVIDNNSSDGTAVIAKKLGATVIYEPKKGKGNALRAGFNSLPNDIDYVVMLDGDNTYRSEEMLRMLEPLQTNFCDTVIGSRLGGRIQIAAMSRLNRFGNKLFTICVRLLYGANVTDVLTGYFAWKKPALDALKPHITSPGFAVEMEMITKMARLGQRMAAVPISYNPRSGESNLHPFRDGFLIFMMLLQNLLWRPRHTGPDAFAARKMVFVSDAIYPYMKGGKEKRLHEITKRLATMGHDVHIYTMHWWDDPAKTKLEDGVYLHALCKYHEMYRGDRRTIKEGLLFGLACCKLITVRFDLLDVDHMPFFPIFSAWLVCTLRGRKLYATWHEALSRQEWTHYMGAGGVIGAFIERITIKLPHRITAASVHTKDLLAKVHGRVKRVELVASGIDTSQLNKIKSAPAHYDVLYVGRLVKDKNVDKLITAIGIIAQTHPGISCLIIGRGVEKPNLRAQVKLQRLQKNITFLEPLPDANDVYAYMKAAKVFCSPSVREGFGIVSLEALGCGTPVITIDSPSNAARDLINDGQNGSIVPLTPEALALAIVHWTSITEKPNIAAQLADCDWQQLAQKQAEVYSL